MTHRFCGASIHINGIVQGVGFRPFVYGLATDLDLKGWVRNTSAGVDIEVDGTPEALQAFTNALQHNPPPLAQIDDLQVTLKSANGFTRFEIVASAPVPDAFQPISPDVSICPDCLRELFTPTDRRYRYPFINCTNCGPRFTIIRDIPYDRPKTTMAGFPMCPDCLSEYQDPLDRRFHAQPVACPTCGPQVWLEQAFDLERTQKLPESDIPAGLLVGDEAILKVQKLLAQGKIVAIKGLGGFHLACDALNPDAVAELRQRKLRREKPFAVMAADLKTIEKFCQVSHQERELLESRQRPIVLINRKSPDDPDFPGVVEEVAPFQHSLGVMLPYTPLHYLLFAPTTGNVAPQVLVMTSGNLSEEPICMENQEARTRLKDLADAFLMHNRPIHIRCDDSVVRSFQPASTSQPTKPPILMPVRRSRGYAPFPVHLPWSMPTILAAGAELKNTFCITRDQYAFLSHHIGDMENYETLQSFEASIQHFERLYRVKPALLAYDLHPDYQATRYIQERSEREDLPAVGVQHHYAHIAACMAENSLQLDHPVIGVAFDGTGYGDDGAIWGGEFLLCTYTSYQRAAHLAYSPLPGGDAATRRPARIALAHLYQAGFDWELELPCTQALCVEERTALRNQLDRKINTPYTSSMGRLFDAVAALLGVRQKVNYEAQAAIEMQELADPSEPGTYSFGIGREDENQAGITIDPTPLFESLLIDLHHGVSIPTLAGRFHNSVAHMTVEVCSALRNAHGISEVVLSGGVWQNVLLLEKTLGLLEQNGFIPFFHQKVPTNDGGIALGQAVVAAHRWISGLEK